MKSARTYLFFDVECANCFGGVGKMCSFGYVITDSCFNIIEHDDIVMNPQSEFDWYLLKNGGTSLAYPKDYFLSQPPFPAFEEQIRSIFMEKNRKVFAFGALNDVGFVVSAFERYRFQVPRFSAFDVEKFCKKDGEIFGSLEKRCEELGIDNSDLIAHKSSDDALMTMRLLQAYARREGIFVDSIVLNEDFCFSVSDFLKKREAKRRRKEKKEQPALKKKAIKSRRFDSRTISFDS